MLSHDGIRRINEWVKAMTLTSRISKQPKRHGIKDYCHSRNGASPNASYYDICVRFLTTMHSGLRPAKRDDARFEIFKKVVEMCLTNDVPEACCKTDKMQGTECKGEGSIIIVHDRTLTAKVTPQFAVLQRSQFLGVHSATPSAR